MGGSAICGVLHLAMLEPGRPSQNILLDLHNVLEEKLFVRRGKRMHRSSHVMLLES